jgi:hypothetical protein
MAATAVRWRNNTFVFLLTAMGRSTRLSHWKHLSRLTRRAHLNAALVLTMGLASVAMAGAVLPSRSQSEGSAPLRAVNMARMKAETLNGGLQVYRAAACMHQQSGGACLIRSSSAGYVFRFYGGGPGWQQLGLPPTVETELLVAPDGRSIREVIYNGPVRSSGSTRR